MTNTEKWNTIVITATNVARSDKPDIDPNRGKRSNLRACALFFARPLARNAARITCGRISARCPNTTNRYHEHGLIWLPPCLLLTNYEIPELTPCSQHLIRWLAISKYSLISDDAHSIVGNKLSWRKYTNRGARHHFVYDSRANKPADFTNLYNKRNALEKRTNVTFLTILSSSKLHPRAN